MSLARLHAVLRVAAFGCVMLGATSLANARSTAPGEPLAQAAPGNADEGHRAMPASVNAQGDLPPRGRSLFDHLVAAAPGSAPGHRIPFPFADLVAHIAARAGGMEQAGARQVLIPLGRSLQRSAAAPDYFAHPRVVVAFDGDGGPDANVLLKDRLYLGYQDAAAIIEVISYNESAGRFEFQVVRDYREGGIPQVRYANRALCQACHQNDAPIFSRRLWSETNANPRVADLLARHAARFHGVPARTGVDVSQAIDDATDRASRLATWQAIWRDGCGVPHDAPASLRCRADALTLAVAHALGIGTPLQPESARLARALEAGWQRRWPDGLPVLDADIPDRDPLRDIALRFGSLAVDGNTPAAVEHALEELMRRNSIPALLEPLRQRPAAAHWLPADARAREQFIAGLAGFFARIDTQALDRRLSSLSAPIRLTSSRCRFERSVSPGSQQRISFRCADGQGPVHALSGRLYFTAGRFVRGALSRLDAAGQQRIDLGLEAVAGASAPRHGTLLLAPSVQASGGSVFLADGSVLRRLTFRGLAHDGEQRAWEGEVEHARADWLDALRNAVDTLTGAAAADPDGALARAPFRRARVLPALFEALAIPARGWCCTETARLPPPQRDETDATASAAIISGVHRAFIEHCGQCHGSANASPPNFLAGDAAQVRRGIGHCAQRIHFRLAMWERAGHAQAKTPMPPASALQARGITVQDWRAGTALVSLKAHVRELLDREPGTAADHADALLRMDYARLRSCLPDAAGTRSTATR
jgi:hypothetical protein